jgi:hypothetical protein
LNPPSIKQDAVYLNKKSKMGYEKDFDRNIKDEKQLKMG